MLGDASFQACDQIRITLCYISMWKSYFEVELHILHLKMFLIKHHVCIMLCVS